MTLLGTFTDNLISDNGDDGIDISFYGGGSDENLTAVLNFMGNTIVDNYDSGIVFTFSGSGGDADSATILFTNNVVTGNMNDGIDLSVEWSDTVATFGGGNTIMYNGGTDIYADANYESNQVLQLISAANTLGTVTYNGWSSVIP